MESSHFRDAARPEALTALAAQAAAYPESLPISVGAEAIPDPSNQFLRVWGRGNTASRQIGKGQFNREAQLLQHQLRGLNAAGGKLSTCYWDGILRFSRILSPANGSPLDP